MCSDPVDQLATAFGATRQVLTAVRDEQWSAPTPCSQWTVRDLVSHMVTSNHAFVRILNGEPAQAGSYRIDVRSGETHLSKDIRIKLQPASP